MDRMYAARAVWRWVWLAAFPLRVFMVAISAGFFVAGLLILLPVALVTMPLWLPVYVYFTEVRHADERAKRAAAEMSTQNMLDLFDDPRRRKRLQWWG